MRHAWPLPIRSAACLALAALLAACGAASAPAPTAPPAAPTAAPAPTPAPTAAPTATLAPAPTATLAPAPSPSPAPAAPEPLPAPLYTLTDGALLRIEPDGAAPATLAGGPASPVTALTVAPDGTLAYVLGEGAGAQLLRSGPRGEGPVALLAGQLAAPRFSPDGAQIALRYAPGDPAAPAGVYLLPAAGGAPALLQPDSPPPDAAAPALVAGLSFEPLAWSPNGARLLLSSFLQDADYCGMAVKDLASGALTPLAPPGAMLTDCDRAAWSADGTSIMLTLQAAGASAARLPGLWRADPATGAVTALLPETLDGDPALFAGARQLADGRLYAFVARAPGFDPLAYPPQVHEYLMVRAPADGSGPPERLRDDTYAVYDLLWAPDASGAVALVASGGEDPDGTRLLWLPADGGPPAPLPASTALDFAWGAPVSAPADGSFAYVTADGALALVAPDGSATALWSGAPARSFAWSPRGDAVAVDTDEGLYLVPAEGGDGELLRPGEPAGLSWSPDGARLAFAAPEGLRLWEGGAARTLVPGARVVADMAWSADGTRLAFASPPDGADLCWYEGPCRMWLADAATGAVTAIGEGDRPLFAPRGEALAARSLPDQPPFMREDELANTVLWPGLDGPPITAAEASPALWGRAAWSADGLWLAAGRVLAAADGSAADPVSDDEDTVANGIAPDGSRVALAALTVVRSLEDDNDRKWTDIALLERSTGALRPLWHGGAEPGHGLYWRVSRVVWSPDGALLAFTGCGQSLANEAAAGCGVWVAAGDGAGLRLLPGSAGAERAWDAYGHAPLFSPGGRSLLFVRLERGADPQQETASVWRWSQGDGAATLVAAGDMPAWRP